MNMPQFTPGPWRVCKEPFWRDALVVVNDAETVAIAQTFTGRSDSFESPHLVAERYANMTLCAAAPELFEALQEMISECRGPIPDKARAALSKALGQSA